MVSTILLSLTLLSLGLVSAQQQSAQIDLGFEIHEGYLNSSTEIYKFSNIRYAQPPVGELRFAAPVPPEGTSNKVENGSVARICPQALPAWQYISQAFVAAWLAGNGTNFDLEAAEEQLQAYLASAPPQKPNPATTEDCLFLDIYVPQAVLDNSNNRYRKRQNQTEHSAGAPVLIWIYGGGYTLGTKDTADGTGIIEASQADGGPGLIFVAINYRLGALGWLGGPSLQAAGGVSNAGLYDQRLAIEWVAKNIHLFGGDNQQITLIGESAGGGSIEHQITAFGGQQPVSFQRAIPQSPGFSPMPSNELQETIAQEFLALANVSTIEEARQLDSAAIIKANSLQIGAAPYGSFLYGPTVDGIFVPALPALLLNAGAHAKNIEIMTGHNKNEAPAFTRPNVQTTEALEDFIIERYPGISDSILSTIVNSLYPEVYDGSLPYTNGLERTFLIVSELAFTCNTNYLNKAFNNQTYAYEFQVPPALHGQDVRYTFWDGRTDDPLNGLVADIAEVHQAYIANFALTGNPNGPGLPYFPMQGRNASMNAWNATAVKTEVDPTVNERCAFWQKSLFY